MSSAAAAAVTAPVPTAPPVPNPPSAAELEDLLYDIIAGGGDPTLTTTTLQAVQSFLHEHARQRKSQDEFLTFFDKHSLQTQPERPALLALPPLEARGRSADTPALQLVPQASDPPLQNVAATSGSKQIWAWPVALVAVAALAYLGYGMLEELRSDLTSLRAQAAQTTIELTRVRNEAEQLRVLVREQSEHIARADHKSELLLLSLVSPLDPSLR